MAPTNSLAGKRYVVSYSSTACRSLLLRRCLTLIQRPVKAKVLGQPKAAKKGKKAIVKEPPNLVLFKDSLISLIIVIRAGHFSQSGDVAPTSSFRIVTRAKAAVGNLCRLAPTLTLNDEFKYQLLPALKTLAGMPPSDLFATAPADVHLIIARACELTAFFEGVLEAQETPARGMVTRPTKGKEN